VDIEEFEQSYSVARRLEAAGDSGGALLQFERAAALYGGHLLEESDESWVQVRRESLKDQYLFVLASLAVGAFAAGDYARCIQYCQQLLNEDRCREETYRMLMRCHARLGQPGRVRDWYELCERMLRADLDLEPEAETEKLYRQALSGRRVLFPGPLRFSGRAGSDNHAAVR
jgi:DNA-binding SARP family transcriptional activator